MRCPQVHHVVLYCSLTYPPQATDNGPQEARDQVSYHKFASLAKAHPHCGIQPMPARALYDASLEDAGLLSEGTGKVWYENLVGGLRQLEGEELQGALTGFDFDSWMIDTGVYLSWSVYPFLFRERTSTIGKVEK